MDLGSNAPPFPDTQGEAGRIANRAPDLNFTVALVDGRVICAL